MSGTELTGLIWEMENKHTIRKYTTLTKTDN